MIISVIENLLLIIVTLTLIVRTNPFNFVSTMINEPFVLFAIIFSLIFAFELELLGNFGALVRYKIPLIHFFHCIYILYNGEKRR